MGRVPPAKFKGHAAQHQAQQHGDQWRIERRQDDGIGQRESGQQAAAAEDQPGFIAVPNRCNTVHRGVAIRPHPEIGKQYANAEIKAVHDDIDDNGKGDDTGPDDGQVDAGHGAAPS